MSPGLAEEEFRQLGEKALKIRWLISNSHIESKYEVLSTDNGIASRSLMKSVSFEEEWDVIDHKKLVIYEKCEQVMNELESCSKEITDLKHIFHQISILIDNNNDIYTREVLGNMGICVELKRVLLVNIEDQEILNNCLLLIGGLCYNYPHNGILFGQIGMSEIIIHILKQVYDFENKVLIKSCFYAIQLLSINNNYNNEIFTTIDNCQIIISTLEFNITNVGIISEGCLALANLACLDDNVKERFGSFNTCELLRSILLRYKNHSDIVSNCCFAIHIFAKVKTNKEKFVLSKTYEIMTQCLHYFSNDSNVVVNIFSALSELSFVRETNTTLLILTDDISELLISIIFKHIDNEEVVWRGLYAIAYVLSDDKTNCITLGKTTVFDLLVKLLHKYSGNRRVIKWCCKTIECLALYESNRNQLSALGMVGILEELIKKPTIASDESINASLALTSLSKQVDNDVI